MRHTSSPAGSDSFHITRPSGSQPHYCAEVVNDIHARLNATRVRAVVDVRSAADAGDIIRAAGPNDAICVAGGRHAMGGQQFAENGLLLDTRRFDRVIALDTAHGLVEVEAGIQWPALVRRLHELQPRSAAPWTIRQKKTGADRLSIGGGPSGDGPGGGPPKGPVPSHAQFFSPLPA